MLAGERRSNSGRWAAATGSKPASPSAAERCWPVNPLWPVIQTRPRDSEAGAGDIATQVGLDHQAAEFLDRSLRGPAELAFCLRRIADQHLDLGRPVVRRVDAHHHLAGARVAPGLVDALPA